MTELHSGEDLAAETRVRLLSDSLVNKIAAGEVIERPASVVKELLENSVDAGATRVEVRVEEGGRGLISVLDNGEGMCRQDALMALERHATSKLRSDADLFRIDSLGFRGEALPSIAEVSRFELITGREGSEAGTRLVLDGGVWGEIEDAPNPGGTEVRVRRLFFNTPVRLKFLKTPRTEMHHVLDTVQRLALSHPNMAVRLVADGRSVVDVPPDGALVQRVGRILGRSVAAGLHKLTAQQGGMRLEGLVSGPGLHRSSRSAVFVFVNGRFVRDRTIIGALLAGYREVLPKGRYPVAVLFLDMPPEDVDVNVHPTKVEVRFRDPSEIWRLIGSSVSSLLMDLATGGAEQEGLFASPTPPPVPTPTPAPTPSATQASPAPSAPFEQDSLASRAIARARPATAVERPEPPVAPSPTRIDPLGFAAQPRVDLGDPPPALPWRERLERRLESPEPWGQGGRPQLSQGELRGRFGRWILWDLSEELILVDPAAAHRRLVFANLTQGARRGGLESRRLLVPELVETEERLVARVLAEEEGLAERALELSDFGGGTLALHAGPVGFHPARLDAALRALLARLAGETQLTGSALLYELDALLAWFAGPSHEDELDRDSQAALVAQLDTVDCGFSCPFGRPTLSRIGRDEVERWFRPGA